MYFRIACRVRQPSVPITIKSDIRQWLHTHCFQDIHLLRRSGKDGSVAFEILLNNVGTRLRALTDRGHLEFHLMCKIRQYLGTMQKKKI